ncbi:DIM/SIM/IMP family subclass B1 metallo-beta-lactamase [Algibacillus agarilyticus]|uniref:DIM/SIM/IMP family subclass B1 metallo-beta-lactamase n=1 Tax=Algibacillus agarilyticus TaxID=2234133 RepID=UPI0013003CB7|nr:DIM/SIM/IMP family subclass B1 metallo-beta-lactamase [Algibacillus agarilyticus]
MLFVLLFIILFSPHINAKTDKQNNPAEQLQTKAIEIKKLSAGLYLHKSYKRVEPYGLVSSNGLVVIEKQKAFIIDTPWTLSDTKKLVSWITNQQYELVGSLSTHSHEDRTAGIEYLNGISIPTYAHKLTNDLLKQNTNPIAQNEFNSPHLKLLNNTVDAFYPGAGHTLDNIVVWLPKHNVLYGGCLVRSIQSKNLGYTGEAMISRWAASIDNILNEFTSIQTVIPGHGAIGDKNLLTHTKKLAKHVNND